MNTHRSWLKRRSYSLLFQRVPVDVTEERMRQNGRFAKSRYTAQPPSRRLRHEPFQNEHSLSAQPHRIENVIVQNRLEQIILVLRLEWRLTGQHFVHEHTKCPPVHGRSIVELLQDFWSDVVRRSAEGTCGLSLGDVLLAHAEICLCGGV